MAGISDRPFRALCRRFGAAVTATEMLSSNPQLLDSPISALRRAHRDEPEPRVVQIAGAEPVTLADFARFNVDEGAQVIDINMGCPVKKVLKQAAGSALLRDEQLVATLLKAVVAAVDVPVTLKIRTGWDARHRNGLQIARIAESAGIAALAVHGRTRDQQYTGTAEYETIAAIKSALRIPVLANGDIDSPQKAAHVLQATGADALLVGRAAQGRPWIFRDIANYLATGTLLPPPALSEVRDILLGHLQALHGFYGEHQGVRIARTHLGWYAKDRPENAAFRAVVNRAESADAQLQLTRDYFDALVAGVVPELSAAA
jgi:tRNA-dihydrouridine synthase B